jgi:hypothetical protein
MQPEFVVGHAFVGSVVGVVFVVVKTVAVVVGIAIVIVDVVIGLTWQQTRRLAVPVGAEQYAFNTVGVILSNVVVVASNAVLVRSVSSPTVHMVLSDVQSVPLTVSSNIHPWFHSGHWWFVVSVSFGRVITVVRQQTRLPLTIAPQ